MHTAINTIPGLMLAAAERHSKPDAFHFRTARQWTSVSSNEFLLKVEALFHGLTALGIQSGDRIAILSENRIEWAVADYAIMAAGAVVVPIYPSLSNVQTERLLADSETKLVFVSTSELVEKTAALRKNLPALKYVVAFGTNIFQPGVVRLDTLLKIGRDAGADRPAEFPLRIAGLNPEDVATIVYTSGTSGFPKGAMLTHRNLVSNVTATSAVLPLNTSDVSLSFLPLSHILQRHADYLAMHCGCTIVYGGGVENALADLVEVRPTFVVGVPRFFEKIYSGFRARVRSESRFRQAAVEWALSVGVRASRRERTGVSHAIANRYVMKSVRDRLGGRLRWIVCGGASLEPEVEKFFSAAGMPILQGYGLTEASPVVTLTPPGQARPGSVGKPVGDVEIRVAADGEILVRGSNIMKGYFRRPKETQEAFNDGWFQTGDVGSLDNDGYLTITDRKKDLIITSTGKKLAPQPIENKLRLIPYFENVVLIGDGRHFISALIVPNLEAIAAYARRRGVPFEEPGALLRRPEILDMAMREIARRTADLANYEKIRKIAFLTGGLSADGGELTPTLKARRSVIEAKFREQIRELYAA